METKPTVICLTPVKNEAWILERFIKCASLWADHIIIADQRSTDGSREIAQRSPKVNLVDNPSSGLDEVQRKRILLDAARQFPSPRLLIALDADEILSANFMESPEWRTVLRARPGTVIDFQWPIISSDLRSYWLAGSDHPFGFMDDGTRFEDARKIHGPRVPIPPGAPRLVLHDVFAMHLVGVDPLRWASKHRWYQCWERINRSHMRAIAIYRFYHRKDTVPSHELKPIPRNWFAGYEKHDIDMTSVNREAIFQWDVEVLELIQKYGTKYFRRLDIWNKDWTALYRQVYQQDPPVPLQDPRSRIDKRIHRWLKGTQPYFSYFRAPRWSVSFLTLSFVQTLLSLFGW